MKNVEEVLNEIKKNIPNMELKEAICGNKSQFRNIRNECNDHKGI